VVLEVVPRLQYCSMHVLHSIPELDAESTENVPLPRVVLGIHASLDLLIINNSDATERLLRLAGIERCSRLLDLGE
jgi:hypothetical protein